MDFITLNDGNKIPAIGFGTFQIPPDGSTYEAVKTALSLGIRHIDTAVAYFNEQEVGQAVKDSGIPREKSGSQVKCGFRISRMRTQRSQ